MKKYIFTESQIKKILFECVRLSIPKVTVREEDQQPYKTMIQTKSSAMDFFDILKDGYSTNKVLHILLGALQRKQ